MARTYQRSEWILQDEEISGDITYQGYSHSLKPNLYLFTKIDATTNTVIRYATGTDYATDWANRASLTYELYNNLNFLE